MAHTLEEKVSIVFPGTVNQSTTDTHKVSDMNDSCLSPCPNPDLETSDTNKIKNSDKVVNCSIDISSLRLLLFALFELLTLIRESWKNPKRGTITKRVFREKIWSAVLQHFYMFGFFPRK